LGIEPTAALESWDRSPWPNEFGSATSAV